MAKYRFSDGKVVVASSPEEFVAKMRNGSWYPGKNDTEYMQTVAERGTKLGTHIRIDTAANFLEDLIEIGIVALEQEPLWN